MKLYIADFGWEGGLVVVANSLREAYEKMHDKQPDWKFGIDDLAEYGICEVAYLRGDS